MKRSPFRDILTLALLVTSGVNAGSVLSAGARWQPLGPFGGPAESVVASPASPGLLFAGAPNALLFRSNDAGRHWDHLPFPVELGAMLHAIAPHPADAGLVMVAVSPDHSGASGLYRSTDGGRSWSASPHFRGKPVWALAHFPGNPQVVAAGAGDGLYLSEDAGLQWRRISPAANRDLQPVVAIAFHPRDRRTIFAGTPHLPWRTRDGGETWASIHTGMIDDSDVFSIDVDPARPERVFSSACSGMYRSIDGGSNWIRMRGSPDASFRTYVIAQDPHKPGSVWAGTTHGLLRSFDSGLTWRTLRPNAVKAIAFDAKTPGTVYLATRDAGLLKSVDGEKFDAVNEGFTNRNPISLSGGAELRVSITQGGVRGPVMLTGDGRTASWTREAPTKVQPAANAAACKPPVQPLRFAACDAASRLWLAASQRDARLSPDRGKTWLPLPPPAPGAEWYTLANVGTAVLAATSHGLFHAADAARPEWQRAEGQLGQSTVSAVLAHPARPGVALAAQFDKVFLSSDQGRSWTPLAADGLERASIGALVFLSAQPGRLFALVAGRGIFALDLE